jgi:hypothetical protein
LGKLEKSFYWLCFILLVYITIGFKLIPIILKDQLIKNLDENLTTKTSIEKIEFNPFTIALKIHNFKLSDENNNSDISFKELDVDFALMRSIEKRHISFQNIFLDELYLNILENKDGTLNLTKLVKPTPEKTEESSSSFDIKFLISKIDLNNADINFTSNIDEKPFTLTLKDIDYTIYDLGTYKDALSSNNLTFRINEDTNVAIGGAFKLKPFKMYGKIDISNLKIKELLDFKKDFFNFNLNEDANINLVLNYNIDTTKDFDLKLNSEKLEINNIDLKQNNKSIASLKKLDIKRFDFDLINQNIKLDGINIDTLNANMISDKNGINFANLIKSEPSKEEIKTEQKDENTQNNISKPWILNLSNIQATTNFDFDDKTNNSLINAKATTLNLKNLKIVDSKIDLNFLDINNSNLSFIDNTNKLNIKSKNTKINLNTLSLNNSIIDIDSINLSKENLNFDEKKSNLNINSKNLNLAVTNLKINGNKISLKNSSLKTPNLNFEDKNSKMKVESTNINLNLNDFLFNNEKITVNEIKLSKPNINFKDSINKLDVKAKNLELSINKLSNKGSDISIDYIRLLNPNLDFINLENNTKIAAKNLDLRIKKLSNQKNLFKIEKTDLNNPHISIILPKNISTTTEESIAQTTKNTKVDNNKASTSKTKLNIGPVNINNAIFDFEDKNLPISFKTTVSKLNGKISEIKNTKSSKTNLELNGVVDKYGVAKITGIVNPNNIKFLTDINMKFQNIAMENFTPYTGKFIGRELKSGKLDLDLKYNIDKSNLDAKNNIVITKLELGDEVQSPDAVSLPLGIAISLLEDSDGVIDINLPISGNVDDPQFSIGAILWKAFVNLITKAVTAPFSLLGAIFNFNEDEIKSVKFDSLESEITPIQKETLDKIAQILTAKQDIAIKLQASYDKDKETQALKEKKYLARKDDDRNLKKEQIDALISKETIKISELEKVAKDRILNIKEYLVKEKSINKKQIILIDEILTSNSSIDLKIEQLK